MSTGRHLAALSLVLALWVGVAPTVGAQTPSTTVVPAPPNQDQLDGGLAADQIDPAVPSPAAGSAPDDSGSIASPATPATPAASGALTPPPYLTPGNDAGVQPVSAVAELTEPDVPLEPLRLAALLATVLAALGVGGAAALRGLGVRTAAASPVVIDPPGRGARARERLTMLADDLRDFLRHSR